jgi:hypothetical protein
MKNYKVVEGGVLDKGSSVIIEATPSKAKRLCSSMNKGTGFEGWTPGFLAPSFKEYGKSDD